jgi:plastocyanin
MKKILMLLLFLFNAPLMAAEVEVIIKNFKFIPAEITVNRGDTIVWKNMEKRQYHSVWFEKLGEPEPDYFFPDETFTRKFEQSGDFPYRCGPHPEMTGIVRVRADK